MWDVLRCGPDATPLAVMGNHQKTVSCCSVVAAAGPSGGGRLLTGALDGHIKVRRDGQHVLKINLPIACATVCFASYVAGPSACVLLW